MVARRGSFGVFGHCCKSSCPGCGLATAPGRIISGVGFRGDRRQAFKPSAQIFCENERALRVLDGTSLRRTSCPARALRPGVSANFASTAIRRTKETAYARTWVLAANHRGLLVVCLAHLRARRTRLCCIAGVHHAQFVEHHHVACRPASTARRVPVGRRAPPSL